MKNLSQYFELAAGSEPFSIDPTWAQGRSVFGGLSAALLLVHIEQQTGLTDKELRTLNVHFSGAITADEPCQLSYETISEGRSVIQVQARLLQGNQCKTLVMACFAKNRDSDIRHQAEILTPSKSREQAQKMPFIKGVVPDFIQHLDLRFTSKALPFSGADQGIITGYMNFNDPHSEFNDASVVALIDAWPPAVFPMLKGPAPGSSVTWNIEFIQPRTELAQDDSLYYECEVKQADLGYAHTEAKIFHPNGELIAFSRQLVAVYDKR
ncbi:thioesterase family protein [Bermanella marisrubri]|uniref:Acyl-CoA thioesterase II, putative n=1 Tax=Bermanella marisrubri TaxID=207949 RepID=Q1N5M3_9GAMM|nr:thioesterase family protein [Bermanella marisrubri]EAT13919.1 acyl-CoA thioesterase II, putative [Oceanobacter sp. RED65] [Bermanella marisrubri]QIZ84673.1 thioesterase family protein [Bermanella marisrubri]